MRSRSRILFILLTALVVVLFGWMLKRLHLMNSINIGETFPTKTY